MLKDAGTGSADDEDDGYSAPKYCPDLIIDHSAVKEM